jgi:hypothetical protein
MRRNTSTRYVGRLTEYNTLTGNTWGRVLVFAQVNRPGTSRARGGGEMKHAFMLSIAALSLFSPKVAESSIQQTPIRPEMQCVADRARVAAKIDAPAASLVPAIAARCFELSDGCTEMPSPVKHQCEASQLGILRDAAYDLIVFWRKRQ